MTAELYLVYYILGIQTTWENWTQIPKTSWDTQKVLLSLQLHIQHLIRSNFRWTISCNKSDVAIQFLIWACTLIKKWRNMSIDQHLMIKRNVENHFNRFNCWKCCLLHPFTPLANLSPSYVVYPPPPSHPPFKSLNFKISVKKFSFSKVAGFWHDTLMKMKRFHRQFSRILSRSFFPEPLWNYTVFHKLNMWAKWSHFKTFKDNK